MKRTMKFNLLLAALFAANATTLFAQTTFDFESLPIPESGFYQGDVSATGPERDLYVVESAGPSPFGPGSAGDAMQFIQRLNVEENGDTVSFSNSFEDEFSSYTGFAISNVVDQTTVGFGNQFAAFPGSGSGGSTNYLISFGDGANLAASLLIDSIDITNTTYAALAVLGDDGFGSISGPLEESQGFFDLIIQGNNPSAGLQQMVVSLANYREGNNVLLDTWQTLDVSELESTELTFSFDGSDASGPFLNTPTYFALDNVTLAAVPEPSSSMLIGLGLSVLLLRRRR